MNRFPGFPGDFFKFFKDLKQNNNRDWFNDNKPRYQASVVDPISEFIVCMAPRLKKISPHYVANPAPHGGSMFRIYRDTRFSKDKTPYKTHAAVHFRHEAGKNAHAPGYYVHLDSDELFFGGGIWAPPGPQLNLIRDAIVDNARSWSRIANAARVRAAGGIKGDSLKRPPRGFDADHAHIEDLKRKSLYVMVESKPAAAYKPEFIDQVTEAFRIATPLNRFITETLDLPF